MVEDQVFFTFIIPTFNRASLLKSTIESILKASSFDVQIIVVDDGGTDNTKEVIETFRSKTITYLKISNSERGAARNAGMAFATGRYINFFDSDDFLLPCLDMLRQFIQERNFPPVVYGVIDNGDSLSTDALPTNSFDENLLHNNFLACGSVFLKREVAANFQFHDDRRLSSAEDWELWLRVRTAYEFIFFPFPVFRQTRHAGRSLSTISAQRIEQRDVYFASLVSKSVTLMKFYGESKLNLFVADRFTFIALAWSKLDRRKSFHFIMKAIVSSFKVLKRRRFWAVLRKLLIP